MKTNLFLILILSLISNFAFASNSETPQKIQEKWDQCFKACNESSLNHPGNICLVRSTFYTDTTNNFRERVINNRACVAAYRHCLAKCRIDYKHALQNQK